VEGVCSQCGGKGFWYEQVESKPVKVTCFACGGKMPEPRKTWLDECAMMAMVAILRNHEGDKSWNALDRIGTSSYAVADAMLAEKMKREAKG